MKKVSLRDFQLKPSKYLDSLPISLTRYGRVVAVVYPIDEVAEEMLNKPRIVGTRRPRGPQSKIENHPGLCKHGSAKGLCKNGC